MMTAGQQVVWALGELREAIKESRQAIASDEYVPDWRMKFLEGVKYSLRGLADEINEDIEEVWASLDERGWVSLDERG